MVPATVPVCSERAMGVRVLPAGIVKLAADPPVENWMAGSSILATSVPEVGLERRRVTCPAMSCVTRAAPSVRRKAQLLRCKSPCRRVP